MHVPFHGVVMRGADTPGGHSGTGRARVRRVTQSTPAGDGRLRSTGPLWKRSAPLRRFGGPSADVHVDVVVVGGGITGLSTALFLAEGGKRVALLESKRLGGGVTGHTTAHLTEVVDMRYHDLESQWGHDTARLVRASSRVAIEKLAELASSVECGFERVNGYLFANDEKQAKKLDAELEASLRAGASVERSELPLPLGTRRALSFANQAQFQPLAYLNALVERLGRTNALIFEGVSVLDYEANDRLKLETNSPHEVTADALVLATHAPFASLKLQLELAQYRSYVVAGRMANPPRGLFWDMDDPYHYIRAAAVAGESYVIVGGGDHRTGTVPEDGPGAPYRELTELAAKVGARAEERWSAQVVESADGLPFIGKPDPEQEVYVAQGFAGNGMTFGTLSALIITDALLGRDNEFAELYRADRLKPRPAVASIVSENTETMGHLLAGHLRPVSHAPAADVPIGEGRVIKHDGHKLAVYRDESGVVHALSAICTHQGCQVTFNAVERSWDCPCHGSRFDIDGTVLDGPAMKPLEKRET
jgi:glycine/D-amino acid oxidase-like deaminating enzyme/nitrite reductase/ring-hydroxylating ferredoxin subunit